MTQPMFIELGMGVDLHGQDATKAAVRAVRDAIGRNYLPGVRRMLEGSSGRMLVHVRLGVPPEVGPPDIEAVRAALPYGEVSVEVTAGGMLVPDGLDGGGRICVVNAAVEVAVAT
ncbi:MAG TPA: Lin0512 family protein [Geminicoccaceae bacterium]|nr:Lin0512 family protein [Geminicoccaceae bacterium]